MPAFLKKIKAHKFALSLDVGVSSEFDALLKVNTDGAA